MPVTKDCRQTSPDLYVCEATDLRVLANSEENLLSEESWDHSQRDEKGAQNETSSV